MQKNLLEVKNLTVGVEGKEIIKGISLSVSKGEIVALMGPNGSGKTTLAYALMGHPKYKVISGSILLGGKDIVNASPDARAKAGLFLSFQYPVEVPGVSVEGFLRTAYNAVNSKGLDVMGFHQLLTHRMSELRIPSGFSARHVNEGFSGGEKKKMEALQLSLLQPKIAVLDEADSGLDVDSFRIVAAGIKKAMHPDMGVLVITHYQKILNYIRPDRVQVMVGGRIVASGSRSLAAKIEKKGYGWLSA